MKKLAGVALIAVAAAAASAGFVVEATLLVIVAVSLIMDVRIWRR